jgi:prepilin-type N-terminal cleavage/methylation domain-containing protein
MARKGFTLIELLIVIAIIGILAAAVVVVLNPAELLAQARDGQRMNDLSAVVSAINLYVASTSSPEMVYGSQTATSNVTVSGAACPFTQLSASCATDSTTVTNGTGWITVNFDEVAGGSPLPTLPMDPTNNTTYYYAYAGEETGNTFEVNCRLESARHRDKMKTDGGNKSACILSGYTGSDCYYEKGTHPALDL